MSVAVDKEAIQRELEGQLLFHSIYFLNNLICFSQKLKKVYGKSKEIM